MKRFLYLVMTDQIEGGAVPVVRGILWVLSQVYRFLLVIRAGCYKSGVLKCHRLSVPVVSVGNLTIGGVGKTPLVSFIAQAVKEKGSRPVILTRGYMATEALDQGQNSDEAAMLRVQLNIPVLAGVDRIKNARMFLETGGADVFLLDDGFQHWRLARAIDIVAVDATNPWGNGHFLPRGILRESKKALSRADIFVLTKSDLGRERLTGIRSDLTAVNPKALIVEAIHEPVGFSDLRLKSDLDLESIRGQKVATVCSIGSPNSFIKTLVELETDIDGHFAFMDHHIYCAKDIEDVVRLCQERGVATVMTTEKDAVKFGPFMSMLPDHIRVLALKIKISIVNGEDAFLERINRIL